MIVYFSDLTSLIGKSKGSKNIRVWFLFLIVCIGIECKYYCWLCMENVIMGSVNADFTVECNDVNFG